MRGMRLTVASIIHEKCYGFVRKVRGSENFRCRDDPLRDAARAILRMERMNSPEAAGFMPGNGGDGRALRLMYAGAGLMLRELRGCS